MSELDDLEDVAAPFRLMPDHARKLTPRLAKAGRAHFRYITNQTRKTIGSRVRMSNTRRKVPITLAPVGRT